MAGEVGRLLALAACGVVLAFVVFEGALRLAGVPSGVVSSVAWAYDVDGETLGPFRAGVRVNSPWPAEIAFEASFNALGCRGPEPGHGSASPVLVMGDSLTFGVGVDDPDTWPAILDRRLVETGRGRPVVNLSTAMLIMRDHLAHLDRATAELSPGTVMLMLRVFDGPEHLDDVGETPFQAALSEERRRRSWPRGLVRSLAVFQARDFINLWRKRLDAQARGEAYFVPDQHRSLEPDPPELRGRLESQILELAARVEAAGARLVLLPFPSIVVEDGRARFVEPWTQRLVQDLGLPYVDVTGAFQRQPDPSSLLLLPWDLHASPRGNAVVAEAALELLSGLESG